MNADLIEADDVIEFTGVVIPPPSLDSILTKIATGAAHKQVVELSAGEARVLHNFIEAF